MKMSPSVFKHQVRRVCLLLGSVLSTHTVKMRNWPRAISFLYKSYKLLRKKREEEEKKEPGLVGWRFQGGLAGLSRRVRTAT